MSLLETACLTTVKSEMEFRNQADVGKVASMTSPILAIIVLLIIPLNVLSFERTSNVDHSNDIVQNVIPTSKLFNMNHPERVPDEYIVVFKNEHDLARDVPLSVSINLPIAPGELPTTEESIVKIGLAMAERYRSKGLLPLEQHDNRQHIGHVYKNVFPGFSIDGISAQAIATLAQDPRVLYVDASLRAHAASITESVQSTGAIVCSGTVPATAGYLCNNNPPSHTAIPCVGPECAPWDLDRLDQQRGTDGQYHYYATGAGVTIWIVDTGLQFSHTEFGGRAGSSVIVFRPLGMGSGLPATDIVPSVDNYAFNDCGGHGTAVASLAAGTVSGVAKLATLRGIDVLQDVANCVFSTAYIIAGLDYVIANKSTGPNILNMSIEVDAGDALLPSFESAVTQVMNTGIIFVTAAGNESSPACKYYPTSVAGVISVRASTLADAMSGYSNYGPCVTLFAPGDHVTAADAADVLSADGGCPTPALASNSGFCTFSGTCFAAPLVAGIIALYLQQYPTASPATEKKVLQSSAASGVLTDPRASYSGSPNLLASVWVPGNSNGMTGSPGGGAPPGTPDIQTTSFSSILNAYY